MHARGLTAYAIAKRSTGRISISTAYRLVEMEGRLETFGADILDALCDVLAVEPDALFERNGDGRATGDGGGEGHGDRRADWQAGGQAEGRPRRDTEACGACGGGAGPETGVALDAARRGRRLTGSGARQAAHRGHTMIAIVRACAATGMVCDEFAPHCVYHAAAL